MKPLVQYRNFMIYSDNEDYLVILPGTHYISKELVRIYTFIDNYLGFHGG